ncbi:MAG TPA: BatA domain-containing protein, partial [Chthonomonadaceae bacterium]|nr:BatA domain-containing protein [Chthonomonadaceae bacterium]
MAFLNPAFLAATALVAIPLIIHLIRRRKLKVIQWAAMEFLRQSQRKQKRRLRIEELILLFLRMLIVLLFVLALARPVLRSLGIPLLSQNTRVYAVIVLDNSFSMDHRGSDGKSSMERAQAGIQELLAHVLKEGDAVSLILLSDKPEELVGAPSYDLKLVGQRARAAKVSDRATDYFAAAQFTDRLLKASKAPIKEVYWFSDDQAGAWETSKKDSARATWTDIGKQGRLTWVSVGAPQAERDNLAVETPTLGRELVTPRMPSRIESRIVNYGAKARNDLLVNLLIDGKPAGSTRISVPAGGSTVARFMPLFPQPGTHTGLITLADAEHADGLVRDNTAPFVVRCRDHIRVLVQDVRPAADPSKSESFYLLTAMAPGGAEESLAPKLREGEGLGNTDLHAFDAVVITGVNGLSTGDRNVLAEYVKSGGGLLLYPGPDTDPRRVDT